MPSGTLPIINDKTVLYQHKEDKVLRILPETIIDQVFTASGTQLSTEIDNRIQNSAESLTNLLRENISTLESSLDDRVSACPKADEIILSVIKLSSQFIILTDRVVKLELHEVEQDAELLQLNPNYQPTDFTASSESLNSGNQPVAVSLLNFQEENNFVIIDNSTYNAITLDTQGEVTLQFSITENNKWIERGIFLKAKSRTNLNIQNAVWANNQIPPWGNKDSILILKALFIEGNIILTVIHNSQV